MKKQELILSTKLPTEPKQWIAAVAKQADTIFKELDKIKRIKTMDQLNTTAGYIKFLKATVKVAKKKQPKKEDPFGDFYRRVSKAEKAMKALMKDFMNCNKAKVTALDNQVATGKIKNIGKYVSKVAALSVDSEYASTAKRWVAKIVDESKIPRQFMQPDTAKITEHLRKGGKPIAGVSWEQDESIRI